MTVPSSAFATQTASSVATIAAGPPPTGTVPVVAPVSGAIRVTLSLPVFATQRESPSASAEGETPTEIGRLRPLFLSIRSTTLSELIATHTAPGPAATDAA